MHVHPIISANVLDFRSAGPNDAVKVLLGDIDLLVAKARVGDLVVVVIAEVTEDLLGRLDVVRTVAGDSDAHRGRNFSNLKTFVVQCNIRNKVGV